MEVYVPSSEQLVAAHHMFQEKEGRWAEYWRAVQDVETALVSDRMTGQETGRRLLRSLECC